MRKLIKKSKINSTDEFLAGRIRKILQPYERYVEEKKMMGGIAFMLNGKMCCGVNKSRLVIRVVSDKYEMLLKNNHCREMDFTGKALKNFLFVNEDGFANDRELKDWINLGIEFVETEGQKQKHRKRE